LVASDGDDDFIAVSIYGYSSPDRGDVVVVMKLSFSVLPKLSRKSPKVQSSSYDLSSLCFAFQRGRCARGSSCPFPHELKVTPKVSIRNIVEIPVLDRFFVTSLSGVRVSSPSLILPGLTPDDRIEYEKTIYPRNSIMMMKK
jgi:hypothetical protein